MNDRITPPADLEQVLDKLRADGIFETKQKAMMFAAAVGRAMKRDVKDRGKQGEGIRMEYFERARDAAFIDALGVTASTDLAALDSSRDEERVETFEKYAAGGMRELQRACYEGGLKPLEGILALIDKLQAPREAPAGLGGDVERLRAILE